MATPITAVAETVAHALAVALVAALPSARAEPPTVAWSEPVEVASGGVHKGPWRMNESVFLYVDDPTVFVAENGDVGVAWVDQSRKDVFFQVYRPDGTPRFKQPVNVSRSPRVFSWLPRIATDDASRVFVLWQEIVFSGGTHGGEIFFARSSDGGRSFQDPVNLSNSVAGDGKGRLTADDWHNGSLDLAAGADGALYAAWTEYEGALWFSRSTDGGERFSTPLRVAGGRSEPARGPALAVEADRVVHVAWTVGEDPAADIRIASSRDGGRSFDAPRIVFESAGRCDAPKLVVDRAGTVHLVYAESPTGRAARTHVRYARSTDRARSFAEPREISRRGGEESGGAGFPALAVDGANVLHVVWELFPPGEFRPRGLGYARSADGGRTFSPPSVVPGSADPHGHNGSRQGLLTRKLAVNRAGAIAVVNSTFGSRTSRVRLVRGRAPAARSGQPLAPQPSPPRRR